MAWYDEAVFYHIYPLGLTGSPRLNDYGEPVHRLNTLHPWIGHLKNLGFTALYIGPLFQSVGHGYETTDYRLLDSRLGTNEDLKSFVAACHETGMKVIFDGVFNHTGRDFFAFRDLQARREGSAYRDWYCNVNFWGNNEYNDGFSYENWGGYTLPGIPSVYYGSEFGIDGRKERGSDDSLRPFIDLNGHRDDYSHNPCTRLIAALGRIHSRYRQELVWGDYRELCLTTQQYAFSRGKLIVAVNNSDGEAWINVEAPATAYIGLLSGRRIESGGGRLNVCLSGCSGEIFAPDDGQETDKQFLHEASGTATASGTGDTHKSEAMPEAEAAPGSESAPKAEIMYENESESAPITGTRPEDVEIPDIPYDLMTVEQLQAVVLSKMAKNGPVTEQMRRDVIENIWHNSLVNWANSFR